MIWYAIVTDREDNDWGTGSEDYDEAIKMCKEYKKYYPEANIAVIEVDEEDEDDTICIDEIEVESDKIIEKDDNKVTIDYISLYHFIEYIEDKLDTLTGERCFRREPCDYKGSRDYKYCMQLVNSEKINELFEERGLPLVPYFKDITEYDNSELRYEDYCPSDEKTVKKEIEAWDILAGEAKNTIQKHLNNLKQLVEFCEKLNEND